MKIITDSTTDLPRNLVQEYNIGVVPLTIHLGKKSWKDFYEIDPDEYCSLLKRSTDFPTTSQPSPQDFINAFAPFAAQGEPVLCVNLASSLSGTYQSALLAKDHFPVAPIEVVDSLQASMGLGLIILLCAKKAGEGASFENVAGFARELAGNVETYFSVDSLDYLQRGGRIGKARAFLGTLMKVKPLLHLVNGEVRPVEKIRTTERLLSRFVELVEEGAGEHSQILLSLADLGNSEAADHLVERFLKISGLSLVYRGKIGGVIASHVGPGGLGVSFLKATKK
ncbi:MAG TPA: DegV family protein [Syntrophorhabdaceae bacterium]|nr:DegV family protein [Syntrophorhabdaceae bacterium]HQM81816.1 DegV family protein [Syntrophorhabdaceae bacterium]